MLMNKDERAELATTIDACKTVLKCHRVAEGTPLRFPLEMKPKTLEFIVTMMQRVRLADELIREASREDGIQIRDYTCSKCTKALTCKFAFDHYNTSGDCLADK